MGNCFSKIKLSSFLVILFFISPVCYYCSINPKSASLLHQYSSISQRPSKRPIKMEIITVRSMVTWNLETILLLCLPFILPVKNSVFVWEIFKRFAIPEIFKLKQIWGVHSNCAHLNLLDITFSINL